VETGPVIDSPLKDCDGVTLNDQLAVLRLHLAREPPVGGIILEHVGLWRD